MADTKEQYLKQITSFYWENGYNPDLIYMERLAHYAQLLVEKNESLNLISRKDINSIIENHIFISAYITKYLPEKCNTFLDVGTGGGLPGIPMAIMRPELKGILVDSTGKKIDAIKEFIEKLLLGNVTAENSRVEDPDFIEKYKGKIDLVISRGTVPLIVLIRYSLPLITNKAYLMALKGGDLTKEFQKAETKYKSFIKKATTFELHYKPSNIRNIKEKKLVFMELVK
jgi:16S rRNA (guanine527-N7)-methyltransferase